MPEYREVRSRYKLAASITSANTEISYTYGYNAASGSIEVGNIIRIQNTALTAGQNDEYMRVKKIFPNFPNGVLGNTKTISVFLYLSLFISK